MLCICNNVSDTYSYFHYYSRTTAIRNTKRTTFHLRNAIVGSGTDSRNKKRKIR